MSLRSTIILLFAATLLLISAALFAIQSRMSLAAQQRMFEKDAAEFTALVASGLGGALRFGKTDTVATTIDGLMTRKAGRLVSMAGLDAAGAPIALHGAATLSPALTELAARALREEAAMSDGLRIAQPVRFGKDNAVVGVLVAEWSMVVVREQMRAALIDVALIALALVIATSLVFRWLLGRTLFAPLQRLGLAVRELAEGASVTLPYLNRRNEIGELAVHMTAVDARADQSRRIKTALDKARSSMMITDETGRIVYVNEGLRASFARHAHEIAKRVPGFAAEMLERHALGEFGLAQSRDVEKTDISLGNRRFEIIQSPVSDEAGNAIGSMLQWRDRTDALAAQERMREVAGAVAEGDFSRRIDTETDDPLTNAICESFNALAGSVESGINAVMTVAAALADGDLTRRMDGRFQGRFASLQTSMNGTVDRLAGLVADIQRSTHQMGSAISAIATESGELAERAVNQAASLEETNATLEQVARGNQRSAEAAIAASKSATEAVGSAEEGTLVVGDAVTAINRIEASSTRITEIVSVIDSISLQTNLLALNAAVEAARAGEAGKGFAVVADEVRSLAQRSAQAARDIRDLIESSAGEIAQGVELVRRTGDALTSLAAAIGDTQSRASEIQMQSQDQATAMGEITTAIAHLDSITQANSEMAEQSARDARNLQATAHGLSEVVEVFRTDGSGRGPAAAKSPRQDKDLVQGTAA
ncbi:MAG: methyl-accepting chemotaxis protein [Pseudomonadota bacterium]